MRHGFSKIRVRSGGDHSRRGSQGRGPSLWVVGLGEEPRVSAEEGTMGSMVVQQLRCCASHAGGTGSIPSPGKSCMLQVVAKRERREREKGKEGGNWMRS